MKYLLTLVLFLMTAGTAAGQARTAPTASPAEVAVSPIECWWKTDRSAVRIGEPFQLTLTCAVLDTDKVKVVVDESSLAPTALHLVPFEIIGGRRFRDISNSPRRFFQYEYSMRVLGEDFFDKAVSLPKLQLTYRVQNTLNTGSALAGREAVYSLLPVPIRVLSLVPSTSVGIRDTPPENFGDVDARLFRSNVLLIGAAAALTLSLLLVVVGLVRATVRRKSTNVGVRPASPSFVLRAASREFAAVKSEAQRAGWSVDLAGRAAAALRLAASVALGQQVNQRMADREAMAAEGQIAAPRGWRRKTMLLSSSVTPVHLASSSARMKAISDALSQTMRVFAAVRYGRTAVTDAAELDAALAEGQDLVSRLRRRQLVRFRAAMPRAREAAKPTWAR
jgi:hypothetical protein